MFAEKNLDLKLNRCFEASTRTLLSLFIATIFLAVLAGTAWTFYDLRLIFSHGLHDAFKSILIDMLTVLALVEILRTALAYLSEGRVKVTYIIDTVIVTVLTEAMASGIAKWIGIASPWSLPWSSPSPASASSPSASRRAGFATNFSFFFQLQTTNSRKSRTPVTQLQHFSTILLAS